MYSIGRMRRVPLALWVRGENDIGSPALPSSVLFQVIVNCERPSNLFNSSTCTLYQIVTKFSFERPEVCDTHERTLTKCTMNWVTFGWIRIRLEELERDWRQLRPYLSNGALESNVQSCSYD